MVYRYFRFLLRILFSNTLTASRHALQAVSVKGIITSYHVQFSRIANARERGEFTGLHTFYTQYFCFSLFARQLKKNTLQDALETASEILKLNEGNFYQYKNLLTTAQWNLLRAIAKEGSVYQPQSKAFIQKHNLGTPAMVKRGLDALLTKEMIYFRADVNEPYYEVYDKFLMRWLKQH